MKIEKHTALVSVNQDENDLLVHKIGCSINLFNNDGDYVCTEVDVNTAIDEISSYIANGGQYTEDPNIILKTLSSLKSSGYTTIRF